MRLAATNEWIKAIQKASRSPPPHSQHPYCWWGALLGCTTRPTLCFLLHSPHIIPPYTQQPTRLLVLAWMTADCGGGVWQTLHVTTMESIRSGSTYQSEYKMITFPKQTKKVFFEYKIASPWLYGGFPMYTHIQHRQQKEMFWFLSE